MPFTLERDEAAVSQPALRPMISTMVTPKESYTATSLSSSAKVVAIYLAAEAKPGQWSISIRSLSMVFGAPMIFISSICWERQYLASLSTVSIESFPPMYMK